MGTEKLWWTWMFGSGTVAPVNFLTTSSNYNESSVKLEADDLAYNFSYEGNFSWSRYDGVERNVTLTEEQYSLLITVVIATILGFLTIATFIGNALVIVAIQMERNLQIVQNKLILSLAIADLLVAFLVMPLGAVYQVTHEWTLGPILCDMWTSSDVLCCTASILHLVAIALDRYWSVTNVEYMYHRTSGRIGMMIATVWLVAGLVCIAPLLGWKDPLWMERVVVDKDCTVSQDLYYQIFATTSSFYLPLVVILFLYWRIFDVAKKQTRRKPGQTVNTPATRPIGGPPPKPIEGSHAVKDALNQAQLKGGIAAAVVAVIGQPLPTMSEATTTTTTTAFTNMSSTNTSPERTSYHNGLEPEPSTMEASPRGRPRSRQKREACTKRERKAAKTLMIITGAFVFCWTPFFLTAPLLPICENCKIPDYWMSLFQWLGYCNSTLNPVLYTVFSPDFREAFKRLLCRHRRGVDRRIGARRYM